MDLDGSVEDDVVRGLIADSYDLVVAGLPRSIRAELERTDLQQTPGCRGSVLVRRHHPALAGLDDHEALALEDELERLT